MSSCRNTSVHRRPSMFLPRRPNRARLTTSPHRAVPCLRTSLPSQSNRTRLIRAVPRPAGPARHSTRPSSALPNTASRHPGDSMLVHRPHRGTVLSTLRAAPASSLRNHRSRTALRPVLIQCHRRPSPRLNGNTKARPLRRRHPPRPRTPPGRSTPRVLTGRQGGLRPMTPLENRRLRSGPPANGRRARDGRNRRRRRPTGPTSTASDPASWYPPASPCPGVGGAARSTRPRSGW
jgi:hypothetical protein